MSLLRGSFHEGLAGRSNFVKSFDSFDNCYAIDSEEDKSSDCSEQESSQKKIIKKKLVFSECLINSPDIPNFDNQQQLSDSFEQGKESASQHYNCQHYQIKPVPQGILIKSPERRNSQKRVDFCLKSKENSIHPFQKKQNEFLSSDKQLKIMKEKIKKNYENKKQEISEVENIHIKANIEKQLQQSNCQNNLENPTEKSTNTNKKNNLLINELNYKDNQIELKYFETLIQQKLNLLYGKYCQQVDSIKLKLFQNDTTIKGMCSREFLKYASLKERSEQMTQQVNSVSQN